MKKISIILLYGLSTALVASEDRACGGPTPLSDVTSKMVKSIQSLPTHGEVFEFAVPSDGQQLIYRNEEGQVFARKEEGASHVPMTHSYLPLWNELSPDGRYLSTRHAGWLFDTSVANNWVHYSKEMLEPLYWSHGELYSFAMSEQRVSFSKYDPTQKKEEALCSFPSSWLTGYKLARGHQFPNVYWYQASPVKQGWRLRFKKINLSHCTFQNLYYENFFENEPIGMYFMDSMDGEGVYFRHPINNFRWRIGSRCGYFNMGHSIPIAVSQTQPVFMVSDPDRGFRMVDLERKESAHVFPFLSVPLESKDLWVSDDLSVVYMNVRNSYARRANFLKIKIKKF